MKKLQITLMIVLSSIFVTNRAIAQNKPLACLIEGAAGLKWEGGRWVTKSFHSNIPKFILVQARNTLTIDSVGKALEASPGNVSCRNDVGYQLRIECTDTTGGSLFFDPKTLKGGISQLIGGTFNSAERDTVTVQIFSCTPF